MKKKSLLECADCGNCFTVLHESKDSIAFCVFCGSDLIEFDFDEPNLNDITKIDRFEPDFADGELGEMTEEEIDEWIDGE